MSSSDSEDAPQLSSHTLAILEEFRREQAQNLSDVQTVIDNIGDNVAEIEISEDWQLSQFWYDETTAFSLAQEAVRCVGDKGRIALISCPTLYLPILKSKGPNITVSLFEYDSRFSIYGNDFKKYDYNHPLDLPIDMVKSFELVIADPPFLSEECLSKVAETIKHLAKDKIILCSGVVMQRLAKDILGLEKCNFVPHHKNNLGNEFACFTNYDMDIHISQKGNQEILSK